MKIASARALLAVTLLAGFASPSFANIVINPGFESGTLGWTFAPSVGSEGCGAGGEDVGLTPAPHSGVTAAFKNCFNAGTGTISQSLPTTPGVTYRVSFFVATNGFQSGTVDVSFGGVVGYSGSSSGIALPYEEQAFLVTAGGSTTQFLVQGALSGGTYFIDDVSIAAVPEPAAYALMVAGLGLVACAVRKVKKS